MASKKTITRLSIVVIIIACAAVLAWLYISGRFALVVKNPEAKVIVVSNVCNQATVDSYNTVFTSTDRAGFGDQMKKVVDGIKAKSGYKDDPTCEYILFYDATYRGDAQSAQTYLNDVKQLAGSGYYPNTGLRSLNGLYDMQVQVDSVKINGGNPQNEGASGQGRG